jgi:hypothetical protein
MHCDRVRSRGPRGLILLLAVALLGTAAAIPAQAQPVVKTVPWVATNPLIPHDTWSGKSIRLKGTSDVQGANIQYTWDFGDGTPVASGTVTDRYAIEASHTYTGAAGTGFTARLTVTNSTTTLSGSKEYYVQIQPRSLPIEVNVAIDEGLWYLHKTQNRAGSTWDGGWPSGYAGNGYYGITALNVNAFEVNGHLETGSADNPYTETVTRGMRRIFAFLTAGAIGSQTNNLGTFNPDSNGNGLGVWVNQSYPYYQGGMFVDAIVASGTPNAITATGPANVIGRRYVDIVQDMVDLYAYGQYDAAGGGGWRYNTNDFPDNSACQWAAIALIPAQREWGVVVPTIVKTWNVVWLQYSQAANGVFGYTSTSPIWGPYATTPSGMVQAAMDGIGRGNPIWDRAETYMRDNFGNGGGAYNAVKDYYYGLFSFVKALLLHDSNGDGIAESIQMLHSATAGVPDIDWYSAEVSAGAPTDGVARTLVNDQNAAGYWYGHNNDGNQYTMETAIAIIILNRTIFTAGAPVAVAKATPNPAVVGATVVLDGSASFHQDPARQIVAWQWDINNDGTFELTGPTVTTTFPALNTYPVRLRVTDDAPAPVTADTVVNVLVSIPPLAPTANAGGPYNFCLNRTPFFLDGSRSTNPDDGVSEPPAPGDFIKLYSWDLNGDGVFGDVTGVAPNVTANFTSPGQFLIRLRVTDNTSLSFPSSGQPDLTSTASAQVFVRSATDPACAACISTLTARAKLTKIQLVWTAMPGVHHYNVYRSTVNGGPYQFIGTTDSTYSTYLDNGPLTLNTMYYYVVRAANLAGQEICQSNQAFARPVAR